MFAVTMAETENSGPSLTISCAAAEAPARPGGNIGFGSTA